MINKLSPKTSFGYDGISAKLLKTIKDAIMGTITVIMNEMVTTGSFSDKLEIAKVIPIYEKDNETCLINTTDKYHFYQLSLKSLKQLFLHRFTSFFLIINYCTMLSMALEQNILLNMWL